MATKKTDILEDFKQRSGQKRQYEEESVSNAGSSASGQTDILEDFKQRSAGAQKRSAKRVSEIQKQQLLCQRGYSLPPQKKQPRRNRTRNTLPWQISFGKIGKIRRSI